MIDSISVPTVTLYRLAVCYTLVMCNSNITSITNYALRVQKYIAIEAVLWHCATKSVFWLTVYIGRQSAV